jgi:hypothetical protein
MAQRKNGSEKKWLREKMAQRKGEPWKLEFPGLRLDFDVLCLNLLCLNLASNLFDHLKRANPFDCLREHRQNRLERNAGILGGQIHD